MGCLYDFWDNFGRLVVFGNLSTLSNFCSTASVIRGDKVGGDGKEIVCEVMLVFVKVLTFTVNQEFNVILLKQEFQKVECNSCKSVAVHDHNLADQAGHDVFQKGLQTMPFEVNAGSDVLDDFVARVRLFEFVDLSDKIGSLLFITDPGVDIALLGGGLASHDAKDSIDTVHSFSSRHADVVDLAGYGPGSKGSMGDAILRLEVGGGFERNFRLCFSGLLKDQKQFDL
jgi:hypothetical protein